VYDTEEDILYVSHYTSSKITMVDGGTGVLEYSSAMPVGNLLSISPNPARDRVDVKYTIGDKEYMMKDLRLRIYDASGRLLREETMQSGATERSISLEGTCPGVYFAVLDYGAGRATGKIVLLD
jgi:hypothetical protein